MGTEADIASLQRTLAEKDTEMTRLIYRVSHDLREPLRKITAFSGLLKEDVPDGLPPAAEEDLAYIMDAAKRMQEMLDELLNLSRVARQTPVLEDVEIRGCVERALLTLDDEQRAPTLHWDPLPVLRTDRLLVQDVYRRLLENAFRYAQPNGALSLHLTAEESVEGWMLGVLDNGGGVPEADALHVFKLFERLHGRGVPGAGMGLAIVEEQLKKLGGRVWVEPGPQGGAHFRFTVCRPLKAL